MKKIQFSIVMVMALVSLRVQGAEKEGGGGAILAAEFASVGREAIRILALGDSLMDLKKILEDIKNTKVIPTGKICYTDPFTGIEYCEDAHYDKTNNTILFNILNWDESSCDNKLTLSSHEFLRAAGLESEDYSYSGRFVFRKNIVRCEGSSTEEQVRCADLNAKIMYELSMLCTKLNLLSHARNQARKQKEKSDPNGPKPVKIIIDKKTQKEPTPSLPDQDPVTGEDIIFKD